MSFNIVSEFENKVAEYFGSTYAVATDSCTHGIELCLRHEKHAEITVPTRTYISVPNLASKLNIKLLWDDKEWRDYYYLGDTNIIDAAVLWKENSYISGTYMCLSFQFQKHLSLGRGGMILLDNKESANILKKMSYDGRIPGVPWRDQDIDTIGYHYYMTPETAQLGLDKLPEAIAKTPRQWEWTDWPDLRNMKVFK
jgi:dTDP-4-amino-4,6-dideoxygalactose transaminase|tara:strand:- start:1907 stop:2497 length:591 start_codon:yes stop_codon:yes gene_type:complete